MDNELKVWGFKVLILDNVLASCSQVLMPNDHVQETLLLPMAYLLIRCKRKVFEIYEKGKSNDTTINPDDDGVLLYLVCSEWTAEPPSLEMSLLV